jgi:tetratricopeptide (TPR) repeat protein
MPDTETLYSSPNLEVVRRAPHGSAIVVITFQSFVDAHEPPRGGFGEAFLYENGFDAIHVISRSNAWYQYADMPAALAAIDTAAGAATRVTYGLSMGAYAAVRFARDVQAARVIAISPQYSIDPRSVPFEKRWSEFGATIRFLWDWPPVRAGAAPTGPEVTAIYDPHNLDISHVRLIAAQHPLRHVPVPYGGHPVTALLSEAGLLPGLILDLIRGSHDSAGFETALAERSPRSAAFHAVQADALPWHEKARRLALHRRAAELAPGDRHIQRGFAVMLGAAGHHAEALERLQRCWATYPTDPFTTQALATSLSRNGRHAEAIAAAEAALALSGGRAGFLATLAVMRRRQRVARVLGWVGIRRPAGPRAP